MVKVIAKGTVAYKGYSLKAGQEMDLPKEVVKALGSSVEIVKEKPQKTEKHEKKVETKEMKAPHKAVMTTKDQVVRTK